MEGNWRHGLAGVLAGVGCAVILSAAFVAGLGDVLTEYGHFFLRFGDIGIVGIIPLAIIIVIGPGALWYGLAVIILRLLGERE
jgi:hypothetical protein